MGWRGLVGAVRRVVGLRDVGGFRLLVGGARGALHNGAARLLRLLWLLGGPLLLRLGGLLVGRLGLLLGLALLGAAGLGLLEGGLGLGKLTFNARGALDEQEDAQRQGDDSEEEPHPPGGAEGVLFSAGNTDEDQEGVEELHAGGDDAQKRAELLLAQEVQDGRGDVATNNDHGAEAVEETGAAVLLKHLGLTEPAETGGLRCEGTPPVDAAANGTAPATEVLEIGVKAECGEEAGDEGQKKDAAHDKGRP